MLYEEREKLSLKTQDMKRAIDSLREEFEAIDLYNQRADACNDPELKKILQHNADEEKEHSAMLTEWIRKNDGVFSKQFSEYMFKDKDVTDHENDVMWR